MGAQRPRGGLWVDTTLNQIRGLKEMIATLEAVVSQFEGGEKKQTTKRREAASVREALHFTEM